MRLPEMLAELEAERAQLDVAINALRLVADRAAVPVAKEARKARPSPRQPTKRLPRRGACEQVGTADPCEHCGEAR